MAVYIVTKGKSYFPEENNLLGSLKLYLSEEDYEGVAKSLEVIISSNYVIVCGDPVNGYTIRVPPEPEYGPMNLRG